jgi:pimeloyl-ACP methyl ester carboxylesterase
MAFEIKVEPAGKFSGKMISLDQNRTEIPCQSVAMDESRLSVEIPAIAAKYTGEISADGNLLKGEFIQLDKPTPLNLKRVKELPSLNRPQTPKKPYPYLEQEVTFKNDSARIELAGTLTMPNSGGPFPTVVLVTGSGPQDRDQTLFEHKPFLVIADYLTRRGIAVLRFDDRGYGKSGGSFAGSTTKDFASDVYSAIEYLAGRKELDPKRIGIIGHSEGAIEAQIVAAEHPDDVAFVVFLAGFGVSGEELVLAQSTDVVRSAGGSEDEVKLSRSMMEALVPVAKQVGSDDEIRAKLVSATKVFIAGIKDEKLRASLTGSEGAVANRFTDPWVRFFLNYDTAATLRKVRCPVLALAGSRDVQVRSKENLTAIESAVRAGGNNDATVSELANVNHLFQPSTSGDVSEYGSIEATFSEKALSTMEKWIQQRALRK